jgi:transmembrane sensor
MEGKEEYVRDLIAQEAAEWFIANRDPLSNKERQSFAGWLTTSPLHVEEYLAISVIARDLPAACAEAPALDELLARARAEDDVPQTPSRWTRLRAGLDELLAPRWLAAAAGVAAVTVLAFGLLMFRGARPGTSLPSAEPVTVLHFQTRHGEQISQRLADNSVLHLNTDSAVTVRYSRSERVVLLTAGEAEFQVMHLENRPFRVFAGPAQVMDLGTIFNVRLGTGATVITVVEGRVQVAPVTRSQTLPFVQVGPDQQISVGTVGWPAAVVAVDAQRSTAWMHRQISFEHEPLARVVSEFNRYAAKPIEIATPALRSLEISGVFSVDDTEAFVAFLRSLEGVHVEVTATQIRVSRD